jgi:NAD(P)-dependent dehydrogenase (short-subunit alcohol dehydrogenase family)
VKSAAHISGGTYTIINTNQMKNIIITGASSGFGLQMAKTLAMEGHSVFATMRNIDSKNENAAIRLTQWAKENYVNLQVVELDVTDKVSVQLAMRMICKQTDSVIDVLINNAGSAYIGLNETLSAEQSDLLFQVNVIGVDRMIKAVLPMMHAKKQGLLITISSVVSRQHTPLFGIYAATKAAVDALSVSYYYELRSTGIDVAIIQPGAYPDTDIVSKQMLPANPDAAAHYGNSMEAYYKKVLTYFEPTETSRDPQEVADLAAWLIQSPKEARPLWNLIGAGERSIAIDHINQALRQLADMILQGSNI